MTSNTSGGLGSVAGLAARLRLLQVDCADLPSATRQEYISEEIGRALEGMPAEKRKSFLDALADQFPAWNSGSVLPIPDKRGPANAEDLGEQLLRALATLPTEAKKLFFNNLEKEAGLQVSGDDRTTRPIPEETRRKLGLEPDQAFSMEHGLRLLVILLQEFSKLESLTWELWAKLAPRSALKRDFSPGSDIKSLATVFLRGESDALSIQQSIEKARKLIAGIMAAIPLGGKAFAEEYMVRFLPQNIEDVVHSRGVSLFGDSMEKKCWNKYKELAHLDTESIEKRIRDFIAQNAEELVKKA